MPEQTARMQRIALWPDDRQGKAGRTVSLTVYLAARTTRRGLVLVLPGGGYFQCVDHESDVVGQWLCGHGFHAAVLRYRVNKDGRHPAPMHDAQRAMRFIRCHADQWGAHADAIGVIGFSAGGHLAAMLSTRADEWPCPDDDLRDQFSARPNAAVLAYPVTDFVAHKSARFPQPIFGDDPDDTLIRDLSPLHFVSSDTPPTYLWHTAGDEVVPVANSLLYAQACGRCGVPYELHVPELGKHGQSMWDNDYARSPLNDGMLAFLERHLVGGAQSEGGGGA